MLLDETVLLFALTASLGVVLSLIGIFCYRWWNEPGVSAFAVFAILLGLGALASSLAGVTVETTDTEVYAWPVVGLSFLAFAAIAWIVFSVQYTGQYPGISWRGIALLGIPTVGVIPLTVLVILADPLEAILSQVTFTLSLLYALGLGMIGVYLVVRTTHRYGHLSVIQGICLSIPILLLFVALNFPQLIIMEFGEIAAVALHTAAYVTLTGAIGVALFHYDTFESTPAVGAIGERAIAREIDDLVFVLDRSHRIINLNGAAQTALGVGANDPLGDPFDAVLGRSVDNLQEHDTVELPTQEGHRTFDAQVSELTDQHDRGLGYIVSLRDITERELRQERLAVLNRVLRHNHRNQLDVIKANAEELASDRQSAHVTAIKQSADKLRDFSQNARSVDQFLSRPVGNQDVDIAAVIETSIEELAVDRQGIEVTYAGPEQARLHTDREALTAVIESAVENALHHASSAVRIDLARTDQGYTVEVVDDGEGIPETELAALEAGTERPLQHGTGLGLWIVKWGITKINGTVAFETGIGTAVRLEIPDRAELE